MDKQSATVLCFNIVVFLEVFNKVIMGNVDALFEPIPDLVGLSVDKTVLKNVV